MSRLPNHDVAADRAHDVALADELAWADGPAEPADGCDGSPWCRCVACERVPAGGFFAFQADCDPEEGLFW